jgi:F420-non-reducing hydrogenase small subunit
MKPKIAFYWCASCGGCEEAVVDLAEDLLPVAAAVEIVFWPVALDFKKRDVESLADGSLAAVFINGAVRSSEQEEMAHILRRKARAVVAFGACAQLGGIPGLANLATREAILAEAYGSHFSTVNPDGVRPRPESRVNGRRLELPVLSERVRKLDAVIEVDYYLPGCAPSPKLIQKAVEALLDGRLPARGSVLAPDCALCEECPRKDSRPEDFSVEAYVRPHTLRIDTSKCILAQGLPCLGPATRGGCEAQCIQGNMPCTGCYGPVSRVRDQGAKSLSALASIVAAREEASIGPSLAGLADPAGLFYRYSLPAALLPPRPRH